MIFSPHDLIQEGDWVVMYISPENMSCHQVLPELVVRNFLGQFDLGCAVGRPFGCRLGSVQGSRHVHLLRPTPDLWTRCLPHRTQILYFADIAFILAKLEVRPGSILLECGTGSGSMTHSLAKAVTSAGRVYTFEFHPQRAEMARKEFETHGLSWVICEQRDVGSSGFPKGLQGTAVFLDLPNPWDVIPRLGVSVDRSRPTHVCCYSPCVEQVLKNHRALRDSGFVDICMYETLQQFLQVLSAGGDSNGRDTVTLFQDGGRGHTSYLSFASLPAAPPLQ